MKKFRFAAFALAAVLAAVSAVGCNRKVERIEEDGFAYSDDDEDVIVGENVTKAELGSSSKINDTVYSLESVIAPDELDNDGKRYVFLKVAISNTTGSDYSLSTLNNFYLQLPDGTELYSDIRTQLYAISHFKEDLYASDPFNIPANGRFEAIIGGFLVNKDVDTFTVGFFPTKGSPKAKRDVILVDITPDKISLPDSSILK